MINYCYTPFLSFGPKKKSMNWASKKISRIELPWKSRNVEKTFDWSSRSKLGKEWQLKAFLHTGGRAKYLLFFFIPIRVQLSSCCQIFLHKNVQQLLAHFKAVSKSKNLRGQQRLMKFRKKVAWFYQVQKMGGGGKDRAPQSHNVYAPAFALHSIASRLFWTLLL